MGDATSEQKAFSSACHGAGWALSRHAALKQWSGRNDLAAAGIVVRSPSPRGVAEEAPGAYKDVGPSWRPPNAPDWLAASRLRPLICVKG